MRLKFFTRRTIWCPTLLGFACLALLLAAGLGTWAFNAESFLAVTRRVPPDVLILEGWIGPAGIRAAADEFKFGGYRKIVAAGGLSGETWELNRWDNAVVAHDQLILMNIDPQKVIQASSGDPEFGRTFSAALAAKKALDTADYVPKSITVLTRGPHARRSRLVFSKVFGAGVQVGVIAWEPKGSYDDKWWHSSSRAKEVLEEMVGYFVELLFNGGR